MLLVTLGAAAATYVLLLIGWQDGAVRPPVVRRAFGVSGPLTAGAAAMPLRPPLPVVRAGYGPRKAIANVEHDPLEIRAVVLSAGGKRVALVLADLVLVPENLVQALEARVADLRLDGLILIASHTHSSVGGFDRRVLAQYVGTGRYREDVVAVLLDRASAAVRAAAGRLVPIHVRTAERRLTGWAENRSTPGGAVDDALTVAELDDSAGQRVATLAVVAAHPTMHLRTAPELSADYQCVAMRRIAGDGAPALVFQGAHGDARPPGMGFGAIEAAGAFVAQQVQVVASQATAGPDRLGFAEAEIDLPPTEPQGVRSFFVRRPLGNMLQWMAPRTARVTVLTVGDLTLLGVPGEATHEAAARIVARVRTPDSHRLRLVSLAQGYVGYIDTPERARQRQGEARRAWFAPELLAVVTQGLEVAVARQEPR